MDAKIKSVQLLLRLHCVHHPTVRPHVCQKPTQIGYVALYLADAARTELEVFGILGRPGFAPLASSAPWSASKTDCDAPPLAAVAAPLS